MFLLQVKVDTQFFSFMYGLNVHDHVFLAHTLSANSFELSFSKTGGLLALTFLFTDIIMNSHL